MNRREHLSQAEHWLTQAQDWFSDECDSVNAQACAAIAQVHATLATRPARGKLLPLVDEQPADESADWNVAQITEQALRWFASIDDENGYWTISAGRYISLCIDSAEAMAIIAAQLGVEVKERPQANGTVHFYVEATVHGWRITAAYIKPAPKPPVAPAEVAEAFADSEATS